MKTEGNVISLDGRIAVVEIERISACDGCHKSENGQGCAMCALMGPARKINTRAYNDVGAKVGDRVRIESATGRMLWYAALVFLLPILAAALLVGAATLLWEDATWQIVASAVGFFGSFFGIFLYSRAVGKKRCDVEITEILHSAGSERNGNG